MSFNVIEPLEPRRLFAGNPALHVPALSSRPHARATLYLDFDGDTTKTWGKYHPGTTPAFDTDDNPAAFSADELDAIRDIWAQVADRFSPFNLNVTTVPPRRPDHRAAFAVVIGGDGQWLGDDPEGGVADVGSFIAANLPNKAFVFPPNLDGDDYAIADAAAHEAGHGFGLKHQSLYDGSRLEDPYNRGGYYDDSAPLMGVSYGTAYRRWWRGTSTSARTIQDDLAILAGKANGFGFAADDAPNSAAATARPAKFTRTGGSFAGVIETPNDADYYAFNWPGGRAELSVTTPGMLAARVTLYGPRGAKLISTTDADALTNDLFVLTLPAGTYRLAVTGYSRGFPPNPYYGASTNVGGYTASVVGIQPPPTRLAVAPAADNPSTSLTVTWSDPSNGMAAFVLSRSADGGATFTPVNDLGIDPGTATYTDWGLEPGTRYVYRLVASTGAGDSTPAVATGETAGDVRFVDVADTNLTSEYAPLAVADLNGDGRADVIDGYANVRLARGDGTFSDPLPRVPNSIDLLHQNGDFVVADFNADGIADLASFLGNQSAYRLCLGNGDGTFAAAVLVPIAGPHPDPVNFGRSARSLVADFNADGIPDLVDLYDNRLILGTPDGRLAGAAFPLPGDLGADNSPSRLFAADFDGDGNLDFAVIDARTTPTFHVLRGTGDGTFRPPVATSVPGAADATPDFDHDGRADLVNAGYDEATGSAYVQFLLANADATFRAGPTFSRVSVSQLLAADFNADGRPDLVAPTNDWYGTLLLSGPGPTPPAPAEHVTFPTGGDRAVCIGDFDGNGRPDLLVQSADYTYAVFLNYPRQA